MDDHKEFSNELAKAEQFFTKSVSKISNGRPRPEMIEDLMVNVESYGQQMDLRSISSIEVIENKFKLQPWDANLTKDIEKAIQASSLGFSTQDMGKELFVIVPALTSETRSQRIKQVMDLMEQARVRVRQSRQKYLADLDSLDLPEDDLKRSKSEVQQLVDEMNDQLKKLADTKVEELNKL